jgi:hypothetical protein
MALPVILGALQVGMGIYQTIKANSMAKGLERPKYTIPDEVQQNLTASQMRALEGLPEEQKKQFVQNVQRASANAVNATADRRSGLVGIAGAQQREVDAYTNLLGQDAAARQANELRVDAARQNMADYKERAFEMNEMSPYLEKRQQAQAMQGSGMQNIFGGINAGVNALSQISNAKNVAGALGVGANAAQSVSNAAQSMVPPAQPNMIQQAVGDISNIPFGQYGTPSNYGQQSAVNQNGTLAGDPYALSMNQINPSGAAFGDANGLNFNPY